MLTALTAALVYGLTGGLTPGPLLAFVVAQTLRHGARDGVKTALAPLVSDGPIVLALLFFLNAARSMQWLFGVLALAGVVYILWLAWESWRAPLPSFDGSAAPPRPFLRGALVNFLNPNPYLFWLTAGTPMLLKAWQQGAAAAAAFIVVFFVCLVGSMIVLALLIARSRERVITHWYRPVMRALALLLVVFAAVIAKDAAVLLSFLWSGGL